MTPPKITVVGSSNFDLFSRPPRFPRPGETLIGGEFRTDFGGKGANQAVTAARLGGQVTLVTRVGRDVFGQRMLQNFETQGIQTQYVFVDDTRASGVADIWVDDQGQNVIIISPGANGALTPVGGHDYEVVISMLSTSIGFNGQCGLMAYELLPKGEGYERAPLMLTPLPNKTR